MTSVAVRLISRFDEQRIERALAPLVGKRLRVANRQGFAFGEDRTVPVRFPRKGQPAERVVAELAVGVRCSVRIVGDLRQHAIVERVKAGTNGSARIELSGGIVIELTPGETAGEYWRVFRPGTNERHFVVSSDGIYVD